MSLSINVSKATFTLDPAAQKSLQDAAERLSMSKSEVVREAILEFHARIGQLGERERIAMLRAFDELVPQIPLRSSESADQELAEVREARKAGGRRRRS